jgi:hypothetical protein
MAPRAPKSKPLTSKTSKRSPAPNRTSVNVAYCETDNATALSGAERTKKYLGKRKKEMGDIRFNDLNAMRMAVRRRYDRAILLKKPVDRRFKKSKPKHEAAKHFPTFDVSKQGKKLPWILLDHILDIITGDESAQVFDEHAPLFSTVPGYKKLLLRVPCKYISERDIMNVLTSIVLQKILDSREQLVAAGEWAQSQHTSGIRRLNGDRFELYLVKGRNNGNRSICSVLTDVLNDIMSEIVALEDTNNHRYWYRNFPFHFENDVKTILNCMINHANYQADNTAVTTRDFVYENHAIIVTFGQVTKQDNHIDLDDIASHQFGFVMSDMSPPTTHYISNQSLLPVQPEACFLDKEPDLKQIVCSIPVCQELINKFGLVLMRPHYRDGPHDTLLPKGSIMSLPSREIHCGPQSTLPRAVMFFTGHPKNGGSQYDDDVQYCGTSLIGDLLVHSWLLLSCEQRKYMLTRWYDLGLSRDEYGLLHLRHQHVIVMGQAIKDAKDSNKRVALIKKMSKSTIWNKDVGKSRWNDTDYPYIP